MYDVAVVGARCAGASLAMLLARAGHRVALIDRASFPSDTMSTHFLWQRGAAHLDAWGLLGRLENRGCAPIRQITFDVGPVQLTGIGPAVGPVANTYCARRTVLDALLVEAAVESGADLIEKFSVHDVLGSGDEVAGIRGGPRDTCLRASVVVGADGLHSTVARKLGARTYRELPSRTAVYYSYWSGLQDLGASFHARPDRLILVWPTNDGLTCVYVAWPSRQFHQVRTDVASCFHAALKAVPGLHDAIGSARQEAPFIGTGDLRNLYRTSAGAGWALVGDAGHHKDPSTGMGMADAFLSAELLAEAIDDGLTGRQPMGASLAGYQARRDALTADGFELALSTARLAPLSPGMEAFYRAAADQPHMIEKVFGVLGGSIPPADVYGGVGR
jgi:flavin-dependent dehydrogenase